MKINKFPVLLLLLANVSFSQFKIVAKLKKVDENGWHKIIIPAEIRAFSKPNLIDFRIFDSKGIELPYIIMDNTNEMVSLEFKEFPIISKMVIPKKSTTIVFENQKKTNNEVVLSISNSDIVKPYKISGSNNKSEWFGLVNNSQINSQNSIETTDSYRSIPLPLNSYRFIKIELNDSKSLPINVLKIGSFVKSILKTKPLEVPTKKIETIQNNIDKKTLIRITFDYPQIIDKVTFEIGNPKLYRRLANVYKLANVNKKRKTEKQKITLASFELSSDKQNSFELNEFKEQEIFIEIENSDNQPLFFDQIKVFQNPLIVIADLETTEKYSIKSGNTKLERPSYDLENFRNDIPNSIPETLILDIKHQNKKVSILKENPFWQQSWFLWLCISIAGIGIIIFTASLVRDMKNNS